MKLFHWYSKYLQNYSRGDIVIMAATVEEAREKAIKDFEANYDERHFITPDDEDRDENMHYHRKIIDNDIAKEPFVLEDGVIFIEGSN